MVQCGPMAPYTTDEIRKALFSILLNPQVLLGLVHTSKNMRGMLVLLSLKQSNIYLQHGKLLKEVNTIAITLIPISAISS